MLKAYAVALVLSTSSPVAKDGQQGLEKAPQKPKETTSQPQARRPRHGPLGGGFIV